MPKHKNNSDKSPCPSCQEKLKTAHPKLVAWFNDVVQPKFNDAHVSCAYRGKVEQNQAHAEGKSQLAYPNSKHNKTDLDGKPCALAIDLFQLCSNGMAAWPFKYFKEISVVMEPGMTWGGNWKFVDSPHYQLDQKDV